MLVVSLWLEVRNRMLLVFFCRRLLRLRVLVGVVGVIVWRHNGVCWRCAGGGDFFSFFFMFAHSDVVC